MVRGKSMLALCIVKKLSTEKNEVYQRIIYREHLLGIDPPYSV